MRILSPREKLDWLRLARTPNVGPVTFATLLARFGSAAAALDAVPKLARRGGGTTVRIPAPAEAEQEINVLASLGGTFIASCETEFPRGLSALDPPPPLIAVLGRSALLNVEMVAIVGARNASALGRKFAAQLAVELGRGGFLIVSGMARGIDAAAHEAALPTGTCAVLAGGVDVVYPHENGALYDRLRNEGVILSEMPMGESPQARHFPRRNRIISGLSRGVIVIEAAEGSGSLITANYALEQGREVFAVPGSPLDPRAKGTNRLIREGAILTETADDVFQALKPILNRTFREPPSPGIEADHLQGEHGVDEDVQTRAALLELLAPSAVGIDELIRQSGFPPQAVLNALLELELAGRVRRHPGNRVSLS